MPLDPVLAEVREEYAQQFKGNVRAMMGDLQRRHAESDRQSASLQPKPHRNTPATPRASGQ